MNFRLLVLKALVAILTYIGSEANTVRASKVAVEVRQLIEQAIERNDY